MFTNLIGYIKPLLRKKSTAATDVAKSRIVEDDPHRPPFQKKDFERQMEEPEAILEEDESPADDLPPSDKMELSLEAIRHLIKESDAETTEQEHALRILDQLKAAGHKTLPFKTDESVIDQIQHYNET